MALCSDNLKTVVSSRFQCLMFPPCCSIPMCETEVCFKLSPLHCFYMRIELEPLFSWWHTSWLKMPVLWNDEHNRIELHYDLCPFMVDMWGLKYSFLYENVFWFVSRLWKSSSVTFLMCTAFASDDICKTALLIQDDIHILRLMTPLHLKCLTEDEIQVFVFIVISPQPSPSHVWPWTTGRPTTMPLGNCLRLTFLLSIHTTSWFVWKLQ